MLGLGLVAAGVFLALVLWGSWDGGRAGSGLSVALAWALGSIREGAPIAFAGAGALLVLRPVLPAVAPLRTGGILVFASLTLALAADTLGIAPAGARHGFWVPSLFEHRGGVVGEAEYWATSHLVGTTGSHVLAIFLLAAGAILITGGSLGALLRDAGSGLRALARMLRPERSERPEPVRPPEPAARELVVRATHVEGPPVEDYGGSPAHSVWPEPAVAELPAPEPVEHDLDEQEPPADDADATKLTPQGRLRESALSDPSFKWRLPSATLLTRSKKEAADPDAGAQERVAQLLVETLGHFGVEARTVGTVTGPHITRYELRLAPGTKVAKVAQLRDDIAYALEATDIRVLAPIPGKQAVGVEVPNIKRRIVRLGDVFQPPPPDWSPLAVWLGKDVAGRAIGADLASMPHLLVAGTTGSGKSACLNAMLTSILLRSTPHEVRIVLVDPKQVELTHYESIPHLLTPVITSPRMAANALANLVREMERRYGAMAVLRARSLAELNRTLEQRGEPQLPHILCVIDELADLMMVAPADVEDSIIRLAQKARAVGIHLVLATQSPRVDVITGMIKANVPSRIAFAVSSQTDSRVILDQNGAETLLGEGDMLFSPLGSSRLQRIQGAYVDEPQILAITEFWRRQGEPEFNEELLDEVESTEGSGGVGEELHPDEDPLLTDAITLVAEMGTASTSMLQRRLRLGYTRAGRLIDMLERRGIISGYEGSKPRQVLITEADVPRVLAALSERDRSRLARSAGGDATGA